MSKSTLKNKIEWLFQKFVNRETITYAIAGVMTTVVNFVSYEGLYRLGVPNLTANAIAWVIAVSFAYVVNKINVFRSYSSDVKSEAMKVTKFFGLRIITLLVEQSGMFVFTELMTFNRLIVKASLAVLVIILNYIFSKLLVFNKNAMEQE